MRSTVKRPAFTLIEILVVVAIIAVLAALALGVSMQVIDSQRRANTENGMRAVMQVVNQHWSHVVAKASKETPSPGALFLAGMDRDRAQVIWIKIRLMEAFPASFQEVNYPYQAKDPKTGMIVTTYGPLVYISPDPTLPGQTTFLPWGGALIPAGQGRYMASFQRMVKTPGSGMPNPDESSALLYMTLTLKKAGAARLEADTLGKSLVADRSIQGNKYPCIVDAWGNPMMFYRFPTANNELNGMHAGTGRSWDRTDPRGTLVQPTWYYAKPDATKPTTYGDIFKAYVHDIDGMNPTNSPVIHSGFIVPTLVSAGRNGRLGLNTAPADMAVNANNQANDNIYSFRLQLAAGTE